MTEKELTAVIIDELKEFALAQKGTSKESAELIELSKQVKTILENILPEQAQIINTYINKTAAKADEDCSYLYLQEAKDCVKALKRLDVI